MYQSILDIVDGSRLMPAPVSIRKFMLNQSNVAGTVNIVDFRARILTGTSATGVIESRLRFPNVEDPAS